MRVAKSSGRSRARRTSGVSTRTTLDAIAASRSSGSSDSTSSSERYERKSGAEERLAIPGGSAPLAPGFATPAASATPSGHPSVASIISSTRVPEGSSPVRVRSNAAHSSASKLRSAVVSSASRPAARGFATRRPSDRRLETAT